MLIICKNQQSGFRCLLIGAKEQTFYHLGTNDLDLDLDLDCLKAELENFTTSCASQNLRGLAGWRDQRFFGRMAIFLGGMAGFLVLARCGICHCF